MNTAVPALRQMPLLLPAAGVVVGLAVVRMDAPGPYVSVGLALALLPLFFIKSLRGFSMTMAFGLVWGWVSLFTDARQVVVDDTWLARPVAVTASVESVLSTSSYTRLRLTHIRRDDAALAGKADLYIHASAAGFEAGDVIAATARWHLPRNRLNPGAFDYQGYCFDRHIALIGGARGSVRVLAHDAGLAERLRQRIRQALENLPDEEQGIILAILLADRSRIPVAIEEAFTASGAAHLLAISGLHVGMVAGWMFVLCWWLLTRREAWIVNMPVRSFCLLAGLVAAVCYATLAGWPLPARRAVLMLAAAALAWWLRARVSPLNSMCAALILILCVDPQAVTSISLWLSFLAVAALLLWAGDISGRRHLALWHVGRWLVALLSVSAIATLATLPVIADVFGRLPVYSLPANIMLVSLYGLLMLPLALMGEIAAIGGLHGVAEALMLYSGTVVSWGNRLLLWFYQQPLGKLWMADVPLWTALLYALGMMAAGILLWKGRRLVAAICMAGVLALYVALAMSGTGRNEARWVVWDVGQGAASSLLLPDDGVMVVDVPGRRGSRFNGGTMVAAGLRALGETHVDVLVLSHAQSDHMGGAMRLLDRVSHIGELWLADVPRNRSEARIRELAQRIEKQGGHVRWLARGEQLQFGDAVVRVLWPPAGYAPASDNNDSLVLSLTLANGFRILMPGDIEAEAERRLLRAGLGAHHAMLVPHHGSHTSSTPALLQRVKPAVAIAQTGYGNRYGFPRPEIIARYRKVGARVWNTADGAVEVRWPEPANAAAARPEVRQYRPRPAAKREYALQWWRSHL
ncbi:MAG: DNA internalization-related competence protein ComEC/Rec2 [Mariprofundaceae bacterium]|nr:DNA internalization-related competence protein ComEC/Rec2 [Mariprofundaceae bacterium]